MENMNPESVLNVINAPEFIEPWLDRFYEPAEIPVLEAVSAGPMDSGLLQKTMALDRDQVLRLLRRRVLSGDADGIVAPVDFHARYDIWALFEGFKDIPQDIRDRLNRWELDHYIRAHEADVEQIRRTGRLDPSKILPRYLLLEEAFAVINEAAHVYLWPCNCRSMIHACRKPVYTCLRFDNSQGQGYEISREKACDIIRESNQKGLMQSGEIRRDTDGNLIGAICNCCPDCCFPHLLAREKQAEKIWPKSFYVAQHDEQACTLCGRCAKRCPFHAFVYEKADEHQGARLGFSCDLCRGCGLCAVTCPEKAIGMTLLNEPLVEMAGKHVFAGSGRQTVSFSSTGLSGAAVNRPARIEMPGK